MCVCWFEGALKYCICIRDYKHRSKLYSPYLYNKTLLKANFFHLINTMFQDTKDKFQSISSFVKETEKYGNDVKLNKDKYYNYWIKTIMVNNMSSSISFSGRAFTIPEEHQLRYL